MKYSKKIVLKNNKECLLRNAVASDAQQVYDIFNLTHSQTDFLLSYSDENSFDIEQERLFLIDKENSVNELKFAPLLMGTLLELQVLKP